MLREGDRREDRKPGGRSLARAITALGLAATWCSVAVPAAAVTPAPPTRCTVAALRDSVTLELRCGDRMRVERLAGVRAPRPGGPHEGGEPFAVESRLHALAWLAGAELEVNAEHVRLAGEDVRVGLLARGLALADPRGVDAAELAALRAVERDARGRGVGVWSHAAWRAHRASVTVPVPLPLPAPPPPLRPAPLAARAAQPGQPSWAQRKAAFEAALRELERASGAKARPD